LVEGFVPLSLSVSSLWLSLLATTERKRVSNMTTATKTCYLCYTPGQPDVPAVEMSPYGYAVCMSHYRSDFNEFVSDYS
jgi:hypothetical protein